MKKVKSLSVESDLPIGTVLEVQDGQSTITVKVVKDVKKKYPCDYCAFFRGTNNNLCGNSLCFDTQRKDKTHVYFKSVKK